MKASEEPVTCVQSIGWMRSAAIGNNDDDYYYRQETHQEMR